MLTLSLPQDVLKTCIRLIGIEIDEINMFKKTLGTPKGFRVVVKQIFRTKKDRKMTPLPSWQLWSAPLRFWGMGRASTSSSKAWGWRSDPSRGSLRWGPSGSSGLKLWSFERAPSFFSLSEESKNNFSLSAVCVRW